LSDDTPAAPPASPLSADVSGRPPAPAPPDRRALRRGVAVVVAIGAVAAIALGIATVDARTLAAASGAPAAIAVSLAMVLSAWLAEGVVFGALAGRLGPRALLRLAGVYLGGSFPSAVTPFASGAIPTWTWLLTREGLPPGEAAAVVGMRSAVTSAFFALAAVAAAAVLPSILGPAWGRALFAVILALAGFVALLAVVAVRPGAAARPLRRLASWGPLARRLGPERAARFEHRLTAEVATFAATLRDTVRRRPFGLLLALLATGASRALLFSVPFVLLRGFGANVSWLPTVLGMLAVQVVGSATPSPGGSGFSEAALAGLLHAEVPAYLIGATVVLWRLLTFWLEMSVGAVVFSRAASREARRA
jgi:glycosyltransferase 2 family protein